MMMNRSWLGVAFLFSSLGAGVIVACANDTPPDVPSYGPPNSISDKHPAAPSGGADSAPAPTGTGTTPTGDGSVPPVTTFACGTAIDGGPCAKSWKTDIFPKMATTSTWRCSDATSCHGGANSVAPHILEADSHTTYLTLTAYKLPGDTKTYLNPCSTDPAQSTFSCNTLNAGAAGLCGITMPQVSTIAGSTAATAAEQADILTWVKCGAPEN